jgi:hypothetical protein
MLINLVPSLEVSRKRWEPHGRTPMSQPRHLPTPLTWLPSITGSVCISVQFVCFSPTCTVRKLMVNLSYYVCSDYKIQTTWKNSIFLQVLRSIHKLYEHGGLVNIAAESHFRTTSFRFRNFVLYHVFEEYADFIDVTVFSMYKNMTFE